MTLQKLKSRYDDVSVYLIETTAEVNKNTLEDAQRTLVGILFYLEKTRRYKENATYKRTDFATYLKDRFNITYATYSGLRTAYIKMPKETESFGAGVVLHALRTCKDKAPDAFKDIRNAQRGRKTPLPRTTMDEIISRHKVTAEPRMSTQKDWKATAREWERKYYELLDYSREVEEQLQRAIARKEELERKLVQAREVVAA